MSKVLLPGQVVKYLTGDLVAVYGTVQRVEGGGTVQRVYGGAVQFVYGGAVQRVYGGTVQLIGGGGTVQLVYGGTVITYIPLDLAILQSATAVLVDRSGPQVRCYIGEQFVGEAIYTH